MRLPSGTVTFLFTDIEGSTRVALFFLARSYAAVGDRIFPVSKAAS